MLTLIGTYIIALSVGAGAAVINDLFFLLSLKHHKLSRHELVTLKQLNNIQLFLIIWMILVEVTFFAIQIQTYSISTLLGMTLARFIIEIVVLFCVLLLRQVHFPALIRHQNQYGHLSDSFMHHSNELIATCAISVVAWFYIILITSSSFDSIFTDFGFGTTMISFIVSACLGTILLVSMKNKLLSVRRK